MEHLQHNPLFKLSTARTKDYICRNSIKTFFSEYRLLKVSVLVLRNDDQDST